MYIDYTVIVTDLDVFHYMLKNFDG